MLCFVLWYWLLKKKTRDNNNNYLQYFSFVTWSYSSHCEVSKKWPWIFIPSDSLIIVTWNFPFFLVIRIKQKHFCVWAGGGRGNIFKTSFYTRIANFVNYFFRKCKFSPKLKKKLFSCPSVASEEFFQLFGNNFC